MRTLATLDSPIRSLVVSPDGATVLAASDQGVDFVDLASGERRLTAIEDGARRLAWGPDGPLAGTSSGEVWTVGRKVERLIEAIDEAISGMAVTGDGTIAVCGGAPFAVATFGRYGNEEWRGEPAKAPYCVRFTADGTELAMATGDGHLLVLDARDLPDELGELDAEYAGGPIFDLQFLPDDNVLVAGARFVRLWDRAAGAYTRGRELAAEALAIAVPPGAAYAVVSTNDQRLRLFGLPALDERGELVTGGEDGELRSPFPDHAELCRVRGASTIRTLVFHPDGTRLFASTEDGRLLEVDRAELDAVARPANEAVASAEPEARGPSASAHATGEPLPARTSGPSAGEPLPARTSGPSAGEPLPARTNRPSAGELAAAIASEPPAPPARRRASRPAARVPVKPPAKKRPVATLAARKLRAKKAGKRPAALPAKKAATSKTAGARRANKRLQARARPRR